MQPVKIVVGIVVAGSFAIWLYAFSGAAGRPPPDELDSTRALIEAREDDLEDPTEAGGLPVYGQRAEAICAAVVAELPNARDASNGKERADQIRRSNRSLSAMVEELRQIPVDTAHDDRLRNLWLDDWEIYISDRAFYAAEIEVNEDAIFTLTDLGGNERLERRLTRVARTNLMLSCGTPGDVG